MCTHSRTNTLTWTFRTCIVAIDRRTRLLCSNTNRKAVTLFASLRLLFRALKTLWITGTRATRSIHIARFGRVAFTSAAILKIVANKVYPFLVAKQSITILIRAWAVFYRIAEEKLLSGGARLSLALIVDESLKLCSVQSTVLIDVELPECI